MRAGDLVVARARRRAVGPIKACRTADGAVVPLETKERQTETQTHTQFLLFHVFTFTRFIFHTAVTFFETINIKSNMVYITRLSNRAAANGYFDYRLLPIIYSVKCQKV